MRRSLGFWWFLVFSSMGGLSCGGEAEVKQLTLSITSDAPANGARLDTVRILFRSGASQYPASAADERFNLGVGEGAKPVGEALLVAIDSSGGTFAGDKVWVQVTGIGDGLALIYFVCVLPVLMEIYSLLSIHFDTRGYKARWRG